MFDHTLKSDVTARRLEVITETGRRRWFSKDDKARIVEETLVQGAVASEIDVAFRAARERAAAPDRQGIAAASLWPEEGVISRGTDAAGLRGRPAGRGL